MIEMRWVWHDLKHAPPTGSICIDGERGLFQKLQYRQIIPCVDASGALCPSDKWTEWANIPHSGVLA